MLVVTSAWEVLGIVGQDPRHSKSSWLHVDSFRALFIHLQYILHIPLKRFS